MKQFILLTVGLLVCTSIAFAQNVGVGTAAPTQKLHVVGTALFDAPAGTTGSVWMWGPGGHPGITMYSNDPSGYRADIQRGLNGLYFRVHGAGSYPPAAMTLANSGNVGVGITTPSYPLHVLGAAVFDDPGNSTGSVRITSPGNSPGISMYSNDPDGFRADIQRTSGGLYFRVHDQTTYPTQRMMIKNDGKVGIGTGTPDALVAIANGHDLTGTAASTTLRSSAGTLSPNWLEEVALASFGIKSGGNSVSLGVRALRVTTENNWYGTALGIGFDVDNTKRAGGGLWIYDGKVGVNTVNMPGNYDLYVPDGILTERVKVATAGSAGWADYVFDQDYQLKSLPEVESFIETNHHLPNVPSEKEIIENGYEMTEMNVIFMEKIEELFLHTIKQQKQIDALIKENEALRKDK